MVLKENALTEFKSFRISSLLLILTAICALFVSGCVEPSERMELRSGNLAQDLQNARLNIPAPGHPVTVEDAVAYALQHNLNLWVARREKALRDELVTGARLEMMPTLMGDAEYSRRSELSASTSVSLESGQQSLEPSYSAEKKKRKLDVTLAWNLVDFGVGYFRSRQAVNRSIIADEELRRARQRLVLGVRRAYWRAAATQEAARLAESVEGELNKLLTSVQTAVENRSLSEIEALEQETPLLEQMIGLKRYEREHRSAMAELASLMGLSPGATLELAAVDFDEVPQAMDINLESLENEALISRPELFKQDREELISADDARVALARMFPSPALFARYENDGNKYLYYDQWYTTGLRAAWDLLSIPSRMVERRAAELRGALAQDRRIALSVGILAQLHIAVIEYEDARAKLGASREVAEKRGRLVSALERAQAEGKGDAGRVLEERIKHLAARTRYLLDRAAVAGAKARIENTVGRNPVGMPTVPVDTDMPETVAIAETEPTQEDMETDLAAERETSDDQEIQVEIIDFVHDPEESETDEAGTDRASDTPPTSSLPDGSSVALAEAGCAGGTWTGLCMEARAKGLYNHGVSPMSSPVGGALAVTASSPWMLEESSTPMPETCDIRVNTAPRTDMSVESTDDTTEVNAPTDRMNGSETLIVARVEIEPAEALSQVAQSVVDDLPVLPVEARASESSDDDGWFVDAGAALVEEQKAIEEQDDSAEETEVTLDPTRVPEDELYTVIGPDIPGTTVPVEQYPLPVKEPVRLAPYSEARSLPSIVESLLEPAVNPPTRAEQEKKAPPTSETSDVSDQPSEDKPFAAALVR